jgi:hypothetical protein
MKRISHNNFIDQWFAGALDDKLKGEKRIKKWNNYSLHPEPSQLLRYK